MIKFGLKLWTSNTHAAFASAVRLVNSGQADFVELYHNPAASWDEAQFSILKSVPVTIHNTHSQGWHEFQIGPEQLAMWQETVRLADYYGSDVIVVHPGQVINFEVFAGTLKKFDDPRIYIENMAGLDLYGKNVFARTLDELKQLAEVKPICFDFEKAVKSAAFQKIDYRKFIDNCLTELQPKYFHISGGDKDSPVDQHLNLAEANFDIGWIARRLSEYADNAECRLVFETPKHGDGLENDTANIEFFKSVAG